MTGYFDIACDKRLCDAGTHFFCRACLVARPIAEQSTNKKYCRRCLAIMCEDKGTAFGELGRTTQQVLESPQKSQIELHRQPKKCNKNQDVSNEVAEGAGIFVTACRRPDSHRKGRPGHSLPIGRIAALAGQGLSSRDIAAKLGEDGLSVSHSTIARAVKGLQGVLDVGETG